MLGELAAGWCDRGGRQRRGLTPRLHAARSRHCEPVGPTPRARCPWRLPSCESEHRSHDDLRAVSSPRRLRRGRRRAGRRRPLRRARRAPEGPAALLQRPARRLGDDPSRARARGARRRRPVRAAEQGAGAPASPVVPADERAGAQQEGRDRGARDAQPAVPCASASRPRPPDRARQGGGAAARRARRSA